MSRAQQRRYGGLTSSEREQRRREQLLEAGRETFAERGWAAATVQDVCRSAGLSPRYFYEHFPTREALFMAVCERIAEEVEAAVRAAAGAPDQTPQQRAAGVLEALADYFTREPRAIRVALIESFATAEFRSYRASLLASFSALAAQLMRTLHPRPEALDRDKLELSASLLSGAVAEALVGAVTGRPLAAREELLSHLRELYAAAAALA